MLSVVLVLSWLIILIGTTVVSVALPMFTRRLAAIEFFFQNKKVLNKDFCHFFSFLLRTWLMLGL
ncbi:hypothetical protein OIU77_007388 [Salix suchowensis]|uniref:ATP synthase F0 subunit 8 n=1 Tax=Salix suchowensis TaxID=1278906 RepID=A0ABQ9AI72_9ROSI|nr:hypothetical protein OIU77_007388 [Salix suchowensis]